jgi:drug/metabolite transporter (DMT)-like permease
MIARFSSLAVFALTLAAGQALFKQVALVIRNQPFVDGLILVMREPVLYAALALYGFSTLLWIWILSRVSLMQAYPWVAANMAIVPLIGWFAFGERVTPVFWLGVVLILAGILLTQFATGPSRQEPTQPAGGPRGESLSSRKLSSEGFSKNHAHGIE